MVATRNHPKPFPDPPAPTESPSKSSPTKRVTRTSTASVGSSQDLSPPPPTRTRTSASRRTEWTHTPSNLALIWLAISLPLVLWDMGYVLLRPHSMPGGWLHKPIWGPYELYGRVDYVYGLPAWESHSGWTAAQTYFNVLETMAYFVYLGIVYTYGEPEAIQGRGAPDKSAMGRFKALSESQTLTGRVAVYAVLLGYSTCFLTFSKTVLYCKPCFYRKLPTVSSKFNADNHTGLLEACSGWSNIGHNDWASLFFLWIIPNGAWLVFPSYLAYVFGQEIIQGLETAASSSRKIR